MKENTTNEEVVFTPEDEKQLIEDCKKFSDDAFTMLESWYKGRGDIIYPIIIEAMKKVGDTLMTYEEHHLSNTLNKLREGVKDA